MIALLAWLLFSFLIAYASVRRKWRLPPLRRLFVAFFILVALLFSTNLLVFHVMHANAGHDGLETLGGGEAVVVGFNPEATVSYSSSTLEHTHSLKPVLYWLLDLFTDADGLNYDVGAALYPLFPAPGLVCPIVIILLLAYLSMCVMILAYTAREEKKSYLVWFNCLVFSLVSFSFFEAALDGGPFATYAQAGVALLSLYLLMRYISEKRGRKWILALIFLSLLVLATLNLALYGLASRLISPHEHLLVSSSCLVAAGLYEFERWGAKSLLLVPILFLLVFNLSSVRPSFAVQESHEGDDVYMVLSFAPSMTDNEVLECVAKAADLTGPEIIARDARTAIVRAAVEEAGVTSQDLAHQIIGGRIAPLTSNIRFRFGDPSTEISHSVCLPFKENELRQALPISGPIRVDRITGLSSDLTELEFRALGGLYDYTAYQCIMLTLSRHDLRATHYIYTCRSTERSTAAEIRDFLRIMVPVTRFQPVIEIVFP